MPQCGIVGAASAGWSPQVIVDQVEHCGQLNGLGVGATEAIFVPRLYGPLAAFLTCDSSYMVEFRVCVGMMSLSRSIRGSRTWSMSDLIKDTGGIPPSGR